MPAPTFDLKAIESAGPQGALLLPVIQQFGMMQQQMMDQFQQSMQMVVQVFAGMHRDQMIEAIALRGVERLESIQHLAFVQLAIEACVSSAEHVARQQENARARRRAR